MKSLYYMAHPVGPNDDHTYEENMADGIRWWTALLRAGWRVCAPWVGLCHALDDTIPGDRALGMSIDIDVMRRCDGIVMTGDRVSSGMAEELRIMDQAGKDIIDLVGFELAQVELSAWVGHDNG